MPKTRLKKLLYVWGLSLFLTSIAQGYVRAADITFLCAEALESSVTELAPQFKTLSGHSINVRYANVGTNAAHVRSGERADVVVISPKQWDDLNREGKIISEVRTVIGRIGIGLFVRKGSPRPNIASVDDLKGALLKAKTIAVRDPNRGSPVGARTVALFDRLGLRDQIMPKVVLTEDRPYGAVTSGKAEIGFSSMAEIAAAKEVDLVGPLPPEVQNFTTFVAAISKNAKELDAGKDLITFLVSPRATLVFKSKGVEAASPH